MLLFASRRVDDGLVRVVLVVVGVIVVGVAVRVDGGGGGGDGIFVVIGVVIGGGGGGDGTGGGVFLPSISSSLSSLLKCCFCKVSLACYGSPARPRIGGCPKSQQLPVLVCCGVGRLL